MQKLELNSPSLSPLGVYNWMSLWNLSVTVGLSVINEGQGCSHFFYLDHQHFTRESANVFRCGPFDWLLCLPGFFTLAASSVGNTPRNTTIMILIVKIPPNLCVKDLVPDITVSERCLNHDCWGLRKVFVNSWGHGLTDSWEVIGGLRDSWRK